MCYNIQQKKNSIKKYLITKGIVKSPHDVTPEIMEEYFSISGFLHPKLLILSSEDNSALKEYNWGLIPSWCKEIDKAAELAAMTLNAKSETVFEKPSFRSIMKKRCVLPVDGFFEWQTIGKNKYPHFIYAQNEQPMMLGCLFDTWANPESGEITNGLSIITTEANQLLTKIHNTKKRMPLILQEDEIGSWLDSNSTKHHLQTLMVPFPDKLMAAHSISKRITDRSQNPNVPEVTEPFNYPELCTPTNMSLNF